MGVEVKWPVLTFHLPLGVCNVDTWHCFYFREDQVNFRGFMRTLAHFRPIEDNEKNKNPPTSEPLNSRTNKLLCEWRTSVLHVHRLSPSVCVCVHNISIYVPVAFRLYDLDRDDKISRDELLQVSVWWIDTTGGWNKPLTTTHHKIIDQLVNGNLCLCWMFRLVQTLCNALLVLETVGFANLMWPIAMTSLGLTPCVYRKTHFGVSQQEQEFPVSIY